MDMYNKTSEKFIHFDIYLFDNDDKSVVTNIKFAFHIFINNRTTYRHKHYHPPKGGQNYYLFDLYLINSFSS